MEHKREKFIFRNKQNKPVSLITRKFTFEVDEYLERRFPGYTSGESLDLSVKLSDVTADFKFLLEGKTDNIDWKTQGYEDIMQVYAFFLTYKKNALLRQLEYRDETLAFATSLAVRMMTTSELPTGSHPS